MARVIVVNPPFKDGRFSRESRSPAITRSGTIYYPIWLAYATGVLEQSSFNVKLVDAPAAGYDIQYVLNVAGEFRPRLVVINTSTPSIYNDDQDFGEAVLITTNLDDVDFPSLYAATH